VNSQPCPYHGVDDVCLPMVQILERLDFLSSPKDAPPAEPTDAVPVPRLPVIPSVEQSIAYLVHGINTWGRPMIDGNLRPVTSGAVTDDRIRALERSLTDLQETVDARRHKGKEANAWEAMYQALRQISTGGFSYRSDPDIQMFANCLFFDRARQVWTKKIAKLPT
jgi:hypothetical protein